jgi:hypothetical protein
MSNIVESVYLDENMLEKGIEFVGLISKSGRLAASKEKNCLNLARDRKEMFFMGLSLQQRMNTEYDDEFGQVKYSLTEREDKIIITIPQESDTLIFVMEKSGNFLSRLKRLLNAIRRGKIMDQYKNGQ